MATPVIMPRQGQSVESCIITKWFKKKGEEVNTNDLLFSYETDKASFEETAKVSGILLDIYFNEGDEAPVLSQIAVIGKPGEKLEEIANTKAVSVEVKNNSEQISEKKPIEENKQTEIQSGLSADSNSEIKISPRAKRTAGILGVETSTISGTGPSGRVIERDVIESSLTNPRLTPLAQEVIKEEGLSLSVGSGFGNKALASDLISSNPIYQIDYNDSKLSNVRKIIAKAMHSSLQNSAQLTHHMSADARKLLAHRSIVKSNIDKGSKDNITLNDMICWCVIKALKKMPEVNSHFLDDTIRTFNKVHLGLAVDTPRGLMVPALRNADDLSLSGLSSQLKAIADSSKKGNIDPSLLQASSASFTVSNLGNYGVEMFTPVINLPQVAILGVCTIVNRPADLGNGVFGFVPYIGLSLTYDHRALDGGPATLFLKEIKTAIENFESH